MTAREALARAESRFKASPFLAGSGTSRLDASLLLASAMGLCDPPGPGGDGAAGLPGMPGSGYPGTSGNREKGYSGNDGRTRLLARLESSVSLDQEIRFEEMVAARCTGMAVAYILGRKEFFGRDFQVDSSVLVPRPDTEILVETALTAFPKDRRIRVLDLCTGSGAIGVTLACERPDWEVVISDLDTDALEVARKNSIRLLGRELPGIESDLFASIHGEFDLIVSNPPYVPSRETSLLLAQGWGEPRLALDGGEDGLDLYRRLIPAALSHLSKGGFLYVESDGSQTDWLYSLFQTSGYEECTTLPDLAGIPRVTGGRKPWNH